MSNRENQLTEVLKLEGIMAQGYGLNPKIVMRDKRLSPEAKCIYAYFSSFAGSGNQAFPSRDLMLDELRMSVKRYYKYLKELLDCDYIRIERCKTADHRFDKNIYTIVALPNPVEKTIALGTEKIERENPDFSDEAKVNMKETKISATGKQDEKKGRHLTVEKQKSRDAGPQKRSRSVGNGHREIPVMQRTTLAILKEQLDIDVLKSQMPEKAAIIDGLLMATEDMASSEQINIAGTIKKKEAVNSIIVKLTADHLRMIIHNLSKSKNKIIRQKAYLQTCLYNSIFNIDEIAGDAEKERAAKKNEEAEEKRLEEEARQRQLEQYEEMPMLKDIDDHLLELQRKLARSIFSNTQGDSNSIKKDMESLELKRNEILKENRKTNSHKAM